MDAPHSLNRIGHMILSHWRKYRPNMVAELERSNQLMQSVYAAQELTGDLLYELTVVQKMDYQPAWELAMREWAFLPSEEDQPYLSFDPATIRPNQDLPTTSE